MLSDGSRMSQFCPQAIPGGGTQPLEAVGEHIGVSIKTAAQWTTEIVRSLEVIKIRTT